MGFLLVSPPWLWLTFSFTVLVSVFLVTTQILVSHRTQKNLYRSVFLSRTNRQGNRKKISPTHLWWGGIVWVGIFGSILTKLWWVGILLTIALQVIQKIIHTIQHQKKRLQLVKQLPLLLQGLSNGLKAGYSLPQAFAFMESELENPLLTEVKNINRNLRLKKPIADVLQDFSARLDEEHVRFFAESTIIQLRVGGNLVHLFSKVSHLIEDKLKLRQDLKTFTSQGKMSGILLASLWPISLLFFWLISPEHVSVLFASTAGNVLLIISLLLELIGFYFIWQIVRVKI